MPLIDRHEIRGNQRLIRDTCILLNNYSLWHEFVLLFSSYISPDPVHWPALALAVQLECPIFIDVGSFQLRVGLQDPLVAAALRLRPAGLCSSP
jgi:hypothetical protein